MKIIVSHPGKQHAYKLVVALTALGHDVEFCTSIAVSLESNRLAKKIFSKRLIDIPKNNIKTFFGLELFRFLSRKIIDPIKAQYQFEKYFDYLVSRWLKKQNFDVFIGYENSSKCCFKVCNQKGEISILDLAQIHYKELALLAQEYKELAYLSESGIRDAINRTKEFELNVCSYIFSISSFVRESLVKNGISNSKILDLPIGNKIKAKSKNRKKSTNFELLYVGTIRDQKGVKLLIESVDDLKIDNIKLKLIGQIGEQHYLDLIRSRSYITHIPYVPNEDLHLHYQQADIFILPSYLDSWGMVTIEALSNGTPVIVTQNCGSRDAVEKGGGIIINPGSKESLINAIKELYHDKEKYSEMVAKSKEIASFYSDESYKEQLKVILDSFLHNTK